MTFKRGLTVEGSRTEQALAALVPRGSMTWDQLRKELIGLSENKEGMNALRGRLFRHGFIEQTTIVTVTEEGRRALARIDGKA